MLMILDIISWTVVNGRVSFEWPPYLQNGKRCRGGWCWRQKGQPGGCRVQGRRRWHRLRWRHAFEHLRWTGHGVWKREESDAWGLRWKGRLRGGIRELLLRLSLKSGGTWKCRRVVDMQTCVSESQEASSEWKYRFHSYWYIDSDRSLGGWVAVIDLNRRWTHGFGSPCSWVLSLGRSELSWGAEMEGLMSQQQRLPFTKADLNVQPACDWSPCRGPDVARVLKETNWPLGRVDSTGPFCSEGTTVCPLGNNDQFWVVLLSLLYSFGQRRYLSAGAAGREPHIISENRSEGGAGVGQATAIVGHIIHLTVYMLQGWRSTGVVGGSASSAPAGRQYPAKMLSVCWIRDLWGSRCPCGPRSQGESSSTFGPRGPGRVVLLILHHSGLCRPGAS